MENFQRTRELTKEKILVRRRKRRNKLLWHVAICSAIIVIAISVAVIALTASSDKASEYSVVIHSGEEASHYTVEADGTVLTNLPLEGKQIMIACKTNRADGKLSGETYVALVELTSQLMKEYDMRASDILRYYDVTGQESPRYFVERESAWEDFKLDLGKNLE